MKTAVISAMFPELKGGNIWKTGKGTGANAKVAISRAFADVLDQVSGRHIRQIRCTVAILESASDLAVPRPDFRREAFRTGKEGTEL